jgi:hypothetical protein
MTPPLTRTYVRFFRHASPLEIHPHTHHTHRIHTHTHTHIHCIHFYIVYRLPTFWPLHTLCIHTYFTTKPRKKVQKIFETHVSDSKFLPTGHIHHQHTNNTNKTHIHHTLHIHTSTHKQHKQNAHTSYIAHPHTHQTHRIHHPHTHTYIVYTSHFPPPVWPLHTLCIDTYFTKKKSPKIFEKLMSESKFLTTGHIHHTHPHTLRIHPHTHIHCIHFTFWPLHTLCIDTYTLLRKKSKKSLKCLTVSS